MASPHWVPEELSLSDYKTTVHFPWETGYASLDGWAATAYSRGEITGVWVGGDLLPSTAFSSTIPDLAGNTLGTAQDMVIFPVARTVRDWVGSTDINDYYRLRLYQPGILSVSLHGLSADADVELLNDEGQVIGRSANPGAQTDSILQRLHAGTYYLRVYPWGDNATFYNLTVAATPDSFGDTLHTARDVVVDPVVRTVTDWVGPTDINDYYRFTLLQTSLLDVSLQGLSANADWELLDGWGQVIRRSTNPGVQTDRFTDQLQPGTYYLRVYPRGDSSTFYNLTVAATPQGSWTNLVAGTLEADTFIFRPGYGRSVFLGNGNAYWGIGARDELILPGITSTAVTWNLASATGGGVLFDPGNGPQVLDALTLADGTQILLAGIERLWFSDRVVELPVIPNDPLFPDQWNLPMIGVHHAWRFTTGSEGVLIGVQDTGLGVGAYNRIHPDLAAPWAYRPNYRDDFFREIPDEGYGPRVLSHGTAIQGIIAALSNNEMGMSGINWNSPLFHIDVLDGNPGDQSLVQATRNMANFANRWGQRLVINMSLGTATFGENWHADLEEVIRANPEVLFVIAAGNSGHLRQAGLASPAVLAQRNPNVIAVGAVWGIEDWDYQRTVPGTRIEYPDWWGSQYGEGLTLMAPSEVIATGAWQAWGSVRFGYIYLNGTSAATPHVTGVASLLWSVNPWLTASQVRTILSETAYDRGTPGYDLFYGHGVVNAEAAVRRAMALARGAA